MSTNGNFYAVAWDLLDALKFTRTDTNVNLLVAWAYCELKTGSGNPWAWNNPLSTTEPGFGGTPANSAGVMRYPTQAEGIAATVATLTNGRYGQIVDALKTSNASEFFAARGEMATWGTDLTCIQEKYERLPPPPAQASEQVIAEEAVNGNAIGAPEEPRATSWTAWGAVAAGLVMAAATVTVLETDLHWDSIREWLLKEEKAHGPRPGND